MLQCTKCKLILDFSNFHKHSTSKTGYRGECKKCRKEYDLKRYEENKDEILKNRLDYYNKTKNIPEVVARKKKFKDKYYLEKYEIFILNRCRTRAKRNGVDFNLEITDIVIPEVCPVLGIPLVRGKDKASINSPSVDRIDPNGGYIKGNIQIISNLANMMKNNASPENLIKFAEWVLQTYKTML
jgi:hypothetical protein